MDGVAFAGLEEGGLDQAPVLEAESNDAVGLIETTRLRALLDRGEVLAADDPDFADDKGARLENGGPKG